MGEAHGSHRDPARARAAASQGLTTLATAASGLGLSNGTTYEAKVIVILDSPLGPKAGVAKRRFAPRAAACQGSTTIPATPIHFLINVRLS